VLRLASLLWRLRRATTIETRLFDIQANHLSGLRQPRQVRPGSREVIYALFGRADSGSSDSDPASHGSAYETEDVPDSVRKSVKTANNSATELARCFLRLANLPNYALDRLSRYEATLWRQAGCLHLMSWVAANHGIEGVVSVSADDMNCRSTSARNVNFRARRWIARPNWH
jgi:hypothetical protein